MIVSSLVVTLSTDQVARARALARLDADPDLTLGEPVRDRLPVVAEATSAEGAEALVNRLGEQDGVVRVDVVAIDFPDPDDPDASDDADDADAARDPAGTGEVSEGAASWR